jgi:hypothetical protein
MSVWDAAGAAIAAVFADPEPVIYTQGGVILPPIGAVRSDAAAPAFAGAGSTLRKTTYEIAKAALPAEPTKKDSFIHRGRKWTIDDRTSLDANDAWLLVVSDAGSAL